MIYGLYLSAQGADAAAFYQAVVANNLANASTPAFKPDHPVFRAHAPFDIENLQPPAAPDTIDNQTGGLTVEGTVTDFSAGSLTVTGSDFDVALVGSRPAFLEVGNGPQKFLTRNGKLTLNPENQLITSGADPMTVLSTDGSPIEVPDGTVSLDIAPDGTVWGVDGENQRVSLGQLSVVEPESLERLQKHGAGYYINPGGSQPSIETQVQQGVIEESGTDPVTGMVGVIQSSRGFEMNMGLIRMQDEMLSRLLQTIPRK